MWNQICVCDYYFKIWILKKLISHIIKLFIYISRESLLGCTIFLTRNRGHLRIIWTWYILKGLSWEHCNVTCSTIQTIIPSQNGKQTYSHKKDVATRCVYRHTHTKEEAKLQRQCGGNVGKSFNLFRLSFSIFVGETWRNQNQNKNIK